MEQGLDIVIDFTGSQTPKEFDKILGDEKNSPERQANVMYMKSILELASFILLEEILRQNLTRLLYHIEIKRQLNKIKIRFNNIKKKKKRKEQRKLTRHTIKEKFNQKYLFFEDAPLKSKH
ncbi:hypothetical protein PanWU01x14_196660 [Parasponia andersonii]|uniref:Uncharacterized protein n=1 Tax=Parasponia andersonii TaxID=3476 RepID=A0A2P5BZU0_PARAD|nr:hypothetical protein PanWU01x14_196660 [Parasponia andersonii]